MNDHEIVLAIQEMLDSTVWYVGMLERIAETLTANGYPVRDINPGFEP